MSTNPHSPLTDLHLSQINNALKQIEVAETQLVLAKQAGIDVSNQEQQIVASKERLLRIKRTYFPNATT